MSGFAVKSGYYTPSVFSANLTSRSISARVWLFGSRVDEQSKGGDIDLYIEPELQDPVELVDAKLRFLLELHKKIGQQKIDVVLRRTEFKEDLPIFRIAKETGVQLL